MPEEIQIEVKNEGFKLNFRGTDVYGETRLKRGHFLRSDNFGHLRGRGDSTFLDALCMGIVERRIRRKLRAKKVGFVSRRASYRTTRMN